MAQGNKLTIVKIVADLQKRKAHLEAQLKKVDQQLSALESILSEYSQDLSLTDRMTTSGSHTRSIRELLEELASQSDSMIDVAKAKDYLVHLKRFESMAAAGSAIGPVLSNQKLFKRLGRGRYQSLSVMNAIAKDDFLDVEISDAGSDFENVNPSDADFV